MLDLLRKELVDECWYSTINENRKSIKRERINGRLYEKHGVECAITLYALKYKVPVQSNEQFKYVVLIGLAKQHPCDTIISLEEGIEIAKTNAMISPCFNMTFDNDVDMDSIKMIMRSYYIYNIPSQFVKTTQEIIAQNKDKNNYNRIPKNEKCYDDYYRDFKNLLM